ncbi:T9SS type A sorting domain-containing protein [Flavobacterium sp. CLA17]|uniref:T9SS type A sorting domain-containing protein n=1 Tax=Flavobacterium sp. CLA17 TaxID=2724135 RepID=UPI001491CCC0|nr:T9SS type A sorting domain-containing protein [Flavobacterium sp. CLA17]QSB27737.1 T9SS type A sorting domain-containing protein [Flavobacterium sp. CLA17]
MVKNYFYIIILLAFFFTVSASAQDGKQTSRPQDGNTIEGLSLYPNPVLNGKVYISSKNDLEKEIIVFDLLGKKVIQIHLTSKELNVADLAPGVYIIKISEDNATATRKLIIR